MIRLARAEDLALLPAIEASAAQLFAESPMPWLANGATTPPAALARGVHSGSLWVKVAVAPVGFLLAAATSGWLHIEELSVAQTAQNRGLGAALLHTAIAAAPGLGCTRLSLVTDRHLPWNAPFYARHGFVIVEFDDEVVPAWLAAKLGPGDGSLDPRRRCIMLRPA